MRKLESHDVFVALRVLKHADIKEVLSQVVNVDRKKVNDVRRVGFNILADVLGNISDPESEKAVYEFLSGPLEIPASEIRTMDPLELIGKIKEFIAFVDSEEWRAFFKSLQSLMK